MEGETGTEHYPIKTVVVLVQENRSFDHILGWMKSLNPDIDGVTGNESNPVKTTENSDANRVYFGDQASYIANDPGHSFQAIYEQVFGIPWSESAANSNLVPTMEGFAQQAEDTETGLSEVVMNGFSPDNLPVYKALVSDFAVCDRWFASLPASTQPNRLYVHSATSNGAMSNETDKLILGFPQKTIFESLEEAGLSFGIYYKIAPTTLFYRNLRKLKYIDNFHLFDLHFKNHCEEGKLPNYVVIEPRYFDIPLFPANDDHPSHDVAEGQKFVKEVYEALRSSPQWNEILFIIIYDEHGGFYDHVPTPTSGIPNPDDLIGPEPYYFKFDRLGVRVPAILVSPWIEPGTVLHRPSGPYPTSEFEHSSIAATVKKIFNLKEFLTKRDAWAGTFEGVLNRSNPRTNCPDTLPEPVNSGETEPNEDANITEFQGEIVQLSAVLNGDYVKDTYPNKIVENMKVSEAGKYCQDALQKFRDECDKAKKSGADEQHIVDPANPHKSSFGKLFSCLLCHQE